MTPAIRNLTLSFTLLALIIATYIFQPLYSFATYIDEEAFFMFNNSLSNNYYWQLLWFCMNHEAEKYLNLLAFVLVNVYIVSREPEESRIILTWHLLMMFIFMQIAFIIKEYLFLDNSRLSPSLVLQPFVSLSEVFSSDQVKIESKSSFPSGHAFMGAFWAIYTCTFIRKKYWPLVWGIASLFIVNRLFSGAHWATDIVSGIILAWVLVSIFVYTPIQFYSTKFFRKILYGSGR